MLVDMKKCYHVNKFLHLKMQILSLYSLFIPTYDSLWKIMRYIKI